MNSVYDPKADLDYLAALDALKQHSQSAPTYQNSYETELENIYNQIVSRPAFSYDLNSDALYGQYKDSYMSSGRNAMRDTMAQAAALTGGYGSSYAGIAGQQQFNAYLSKLNDMVPQLYDRALDSYNSAGAQLKADFDMVNSQAQAEYQRYMDELGIFNDRTDYLTQRLDTAYKQGFDERSDAYEKLTALMAYSGYNPTDDDLKQSGMTRQQADAYLKAWQTSNPLLAYMNGAIDAEQYYQITGTYPPGYSAGGGYYGGGSKKKKKEEGVDVVDIASQRAQIEADYHAGRIDYDDRENLVNKLYGWK